MLETIQPPTDGTVGVDWHQTLRGSPEFQEVKTELGRLCGLTTAAGKETADALQTTGEPSQHREFVTSFWTQFFIVLDRTWKHFWRSPTYIWSKIALIVISVSGMNECRLEK